MSRIYSLHLTGFKVSFSNFFDFYTADPGLLLHFTPSCRIFMYIPVSQFFFTDFWYKTSKLKRNTLGSSSFSILSNKNKKKKNSGVRSDEKTNFTVKL